MNSYIKLITNLFVILLALIGKISANQFDCATLPNGSYPSCPCCQDFYVCVSGMTILQRCPGDLVYQPELDQCLPRSANPACGVSKDSSVCIENCIGQQDGIYQYCQSCNEAIACFSGTYFIFRCPDPDKPEYDSNLRNCVNKSNTCP